MICSWYQLCIQGTHVRSEFFKLRYSYKHFLYSRYNLYRRQLHSELRYTAQRQHRDTVHLD
jgi:hypothetical protein